jgi:hypothetical protein
MMYEAEYTCGKLNIKTTYYPTCPGEGGQGWQAQADTGLRLFREVGAWGYSEAQALNNLLDWLRMLGFLPGGEMRDDVVVL